MIADTVRPGTAGAWPEGRLSSEPGYCSCQTFAENAEVVCSAVGCESILPRAGVDEFSDVMHPYVEHTALAHKSPVGGGQFQFRMGIARSEDDGQLRPLRPFWRLENVRQAWLRLCHCYCAQGVIYQFRLEVPNGIGICHD